MDRSRFSLPLRIGTISSFRERNNEISGGRPRREVALTDNHDSVGSRLIDGLWWDRGLDFPRVHEASFKLFAVEHHFVKTIEAPTRGNLDGRAGSLWDGAWRDLNVARRAAPRAGVGDGILKICMKLVVDNPAVHDHQLYVLDRPHVLYRIAFHGD